MKVVRMWRGGRELSSREHLSILLRVVYRGMVFPSSSGINEVHIARKKSIFMEE